MLTGPDRIEKVENWMALLERNVAQAPTEEQWTKMRRLREERHAVSEKKARIIHVTTKIDKNNEARGQAIGIIGDFKRARMTQEERRAAVEADTEWLFGPKRKKERGGTI